MSIPTIYLVRHGQSEHHLNDQTGGWTDSILTEAGHLQAERVAARLKKELADVPASLVSSDLKRASQTAEHIARTLDLPLNLDPSLREINNGQGANKSHAEAEKIRQPIEGPRLDWQPYPDAETWRAFYQRTVAGVEKIIRNYPNPLVLVTHGGTLINITAWWLHISPEHLDKISFQFDPACLSILKINPWNERSVYLLNDTSHLDGLHR
jgi:broad specificity phosphatase PhoE